MNLLNQIPNLSQLALESSEVGIWVWRPKTGEFDFDKKWCEMTGVSYDLAPREVETWKNQVHPEDLAEVLAKANFMLQDGRSKWENIHRLRQPDGSWRWVLSRITVIDRFEDRSASMIMGTHLDISPFKEQEAFAEEVQKLANIGGWFLDLKTSKTYWTSGTYRIHGLPLGTPTDKSKGIRYFIHPDQERIQHALEKCINGGSFRDRFQMVDTNGIHKWVEVTGQSDMDADGVVSGVRGTMQDVTYLAKKDSELITQKERLERLMQNSPGMVYQFVLEPNGRMYFPYVSQKAFDIYELQPEDFEKNPSIMLEMADIESRDGLHVAILESAKSLKPFDWRGRICTNTGKTRWIHARSVPTLQENGLILWDGIVMDVSREQELSEKLKKEQVLLVQQSKLISLGEMAAGVAHEINNPLAIVAGKIETLAQARNDEALYAKGIEACTKAIHRISKIIKSLQKFSRSGQLTDRSNQPIRQIVEEVILLTQPKAHRAQVEIRSKIDSDLYINCNLVEIEQVFINLINNGIDAAREGKDVARWVGIHVFDRGAEVIVRITDSGLGIPVVVKDRMFEPFLTTKPVGEGTGLGLSIVKAILDQHSASIRLDEQDPATCFELSFHSVVLAR